MTKVNEKSLRNLSETKGIIFEKYLRNLSEFKGIIFEENI